MIMYHNENKTKDDKIEPPYRTKVYPQLGIVLVTDKHEIPKLL